MHNEILRSYRGSVDTTIRIWEISVDHYESKSLTTLEGHESTVWAIAADTIKIVSGGADNEIRIWDANTFICLKTLRGHSKAVRCLDIGSDFIISGSTDGIIKFYDLDPTVENWHK